MGRHLRKEESREEQEEGQLTLVTQDRQESLVRSFVVQASRLAFLVTRTRVHFSSRHPDSSALRAVWPLWRSFTACISSMLSK